MRVRAVIPPVYNGLETIVTVYRWTCIMEQIFRVQKVPYSIWVAIVTQYFMRCVLQWWNHQRNHSQSYHWEHFTFVIQRFFGTFPGVDVEVIGIPMIDPEPTEHMDSSQEKN